ncbi:PREDICTED: uncharacterized protein LOC107335912 [Acropora digitifera]|uniref:uncharacterized protein LOC107335912 n=1 Tax=Acropora digitifera TaxID=70779 RepID=UPI00077AA3CC|nr:PREDICTED: uncharacterized protein LOC107335912 [Acropora digitifera]
MSSTSTANSTPASASKVKIRHTVKTFRLQEFTKKYLCTELPDFDNVTGKEWDTRAKAYIRQRVKIMIEDREIGLTERDYASWSMKDIHSTMASPAMESSENVEEVSEVQEVQENKSWDDVIDEEGDHANEQESQRTSLITPQEDGMPVPGDIKRMMHNGANFTRTKESWNIEEETVSSRKSFSVYFSLDTHVPTNAIIEAFDTAGVDYEDILSIQRRLSSNTWVVAFRTARAKEQVLSACHRVFVADCDRKISLDKVYNAPNEMPDSVIIGRLSVANVSVTVQTVQNAVKAPRTVAFHSVLPSVLSKPSEDQGEKAREKEKQARTKEKRRTSEVPKESSRRSYERGLESRKRDGRDVAWDRGRERDPDCDRDREREREREWYRDRSHHHRRERSGDEDRHKKIERSRSGAESSKPWEIQ